MTRANEIKRNSCSVRVAAAISDKLSAGQSPPPPHSRPLWQQQPNLWHIPNSSSKDRLNQRLISRIASVLALIKTLHFFSPPPPFLHAQKNRMTSEPGIPSTIQQLTKTSSHPSSLADVTTHNFLVVFSSSRTVNCFYLHLFVGCPFSKQSNHSNSNGKKKNDTSGDDISWQTTPRCWSTRNDGVSPAR